MTKIVDLRPGITNWRLMLDRIRDCEGVEAVVCAVRIDGQWSTCWSVESIGGLAMGTMKLFRDVSNAMESENEAWPGGTCP